MLLSCPFPVWSCAICKLGTPPRNQNSQMLSTKIPNVCSSQSPCIHGH